NEPSAHRVAGGNDPEGRRAARIEALRRERRREVRPFGPVRGIRVLRIYGAIAARLRGVIFDMDGVLVLSEPFIAAAAIAMFAEKGFTVRPEEFRPFIGTGEDRFIGGVAEARAIPIEPERDKARNEIYLEQIRGRLRPL